MTDARPLRGLSILLIDDDRLAGFRLHRGLVAAGARVASGNLETAEPYLDAAALAAVVVSADLNPVDARRLAPRLTGCKAPWVAYGEAATGDLPEPVARVHLSLPLLVETLAALGSRIRH